MILAPSGKGAPRGRENIPLSKSVARFEKTLQAIRIH